MSEVLSASLNRTYAKGLARGAGAALLFALPLLMTMEMWWLGGFAVERMRLLIFLVVSLPMLLGLSYFAGFEPTFRLKDEILDALAAYGIGFAVSASALAVFAVLNGVSVGDMVGKVAICTIPAAIGALLGGKQFAQRNEDDQRERGDAGYAGVLFLMAVGAVFLAFNVAPTEEMVLISHLMGPVHALALIALSVLALHVFVYALGFPGEARRRGVASIRRTVFVFTLPGYAIALGVSVYCLWTFGRLDGVALHEQATMAVVLAFPAALGAATARLVV
jgi:putative integral membrane protein (TIGR02587 family)